MHSSEFVNIGVLMAKAIAVVNSCETEMQYHNAATYVELCRAAVRKELQRRGTPNEYSFGIVNDALRYNKFSCLYADI